MEFRCLLRSNTSRGVQRQPAAGIMTDVYDTPAWKKMMGEVGQVLERIGIHFCIDGIPAFTYKVGFDELPDYLSAIV